MKIIRTTCLILLLFPLLVNATAQRELKILAMLWRGETLADKEFKNYLNKIGLKYRLDVFNSEQDRKNLTQYLQLADLSNYDYVYTYGTTVTQFTNSFSNAKNIIFSSVSDPYRSKILPLIGKPPNNISGVINSDTLGKLINSVKPYIGDKKIIAPFNIRENNSNVFVERIPSIEEAYSVSIQPVQITPEYSEEKITTILESIISEDKDIALLLLDDSCVIYNSKIIANLMTKHKIFTFGASTNTVKDGGVALGISVDPVIVGRMTAEILYSSFKNNIPLRDIKPRTPENLKLFINKNTFDQLGIEIASNHKSCENGCLLEKAS